MLANEWGGIHVVWVGTNGIYKVGNVEIKSKRMDQIGKEGFNLSTRRRLLK